MHIQPVICGAEGCVSFVCAEVSEGVMSKSVEGLTEVVDARNKKAVVEEEEAILEMCAEIGLQIFEEFCAERIIFVSVLDVEKEMVVTRNLQDGSSDEEGGGSRRDWGEGIGNCIFFAFGLFDGKVILQKQFLPTHLSTRNHGGC